MYWYLELERNRPISRMRELERLRHSYRCPACGSDLVKARGKQSGRKFLYCRECGKRYEYWEVKSKFDELPAKKIKEIAEVIQGWVSARGRYLYVPNEKEYWYYLQPHMIKGISGGNRSGKTCTTVIDMVMQIEGWHPLQRENLKMLAEEAIDVRVREIARELLSDGKWIHDPPIQARVVAPDYSNYVDKILGPEYEKWLTHSEVKEISYDNDRRRRIEWKNGSMLEFLTTQQDIKSHGGSARHAIQVDEECPQDYWIENMMRIISVGGRMLIGATAVDGVTWTEKEIWEPGEKGHPDIYVMTLSTYDNPVNTKEVIEKIKGQCRDQVEIDIRIYGKRRMRGGHVYPEYQEREPWVIKPFRIPKEGGQLILAVDPHPSIPHAVLWVWVDFDGRFHSLIDGKPNLYEVAYMFRGGTIPELVQKIREIEDNYWVLNGRRHGFFLLDPSAWNKSQTEENTKTVYDLFVENGLYPMKGSKDLVGGILEVRELLKVDEGAEIDHPRLMTFNDNSVNFNDPPYHNENYLLYEKRSYHYPDPRRDFMMGKTPKQKPVDKDDHLMENERRIVQFVNGVIGDAIDLNEYVPQLLYNGSVVEYDWDLSEDDDF